MCDWLVCCNSAVGGADRSRRKIRRLFSRLDLSNTSAHLCFGKKKEKILLLRLWSVYITFYIILNRYYWTLLYGVVYIFTQMTFSRGSFGCAVRLETRRSRVQRPPRSATFFRGDWSWNIFYGHSLPSADSRRAVVSFWRKNVHNTG